MLESLCTISALSGFGPTLLSLGRLRLRVPLLWQAAVSGRQEIARVPQGAPECRLRGGRHHQVPLAGAHAVLAGPRIVSDQRGQRRIGALDQAGQSPLPDLRAALGDVIEQAHDCVGEGRAASRRQEVADLLHLPARLYGGEQLASLQTPDKIRN